MFKYCSIMADQPKVTLDLPAPDTRQLSDAPLDVVVCQLQYDTNLAVSDTKTARALHDALGGRHGTYPRVEQIQTRSISLDMTAGVSPSLSSSPGSGWRFAAEDGTWIVSILAEHVSVETSAYQNWNDFRDRLRVVLEAVAVHVDPVFEQRLGLRYIDRLVTPDVASPADWEKVVAPHLLGPVLHQGIGPAIRVAQQHLVLALDEDGEAQCGFRHGFVVAADDEPAYVLDYDVHRSVGRPFNVNDALAGADQFNQYALQLFQASITPAYWKGLA